jgi:hypothetical protein
MKNTMRWLLIALIATIVFGFAACGSPTGGGGTVDDTVNIAAIPGVTAPATGVAPVTAITPTEQYTGTVTWDPAVSGTFAASTDYTATITLTAKAGFTLQGVGVNFFTVNGATATNAANLGTVTAVFPQTGADPATVINIAAITGVTAPTTGVAPVTTITETEQYTGTVTWNGNPSTFAASTDYTATITLTAKAGFTLQGVGANFFTVVGATATNLVNSGTVTAKFPQTAATISTAAIAGVTVPVPGATPVTTITETEQYTGTVAWNGSPATFAEGTVYTATIILTANADYTLHGVGANFFTVVGATATNLVNSGTVTAVFPATPILVTGVTLQPTLDLVVNDGDRKTNILNATVEPSDATNPSVTWESDNTDVVTVNSSTGLVTAHAAGTATITVTTTDQGKTATCAVTVQQTEIFTFTVDMDDAAPNITGPVISISGDNGPTTETITVQNPGQYTSVIWYITGMGICVRGNSIELDSANTAYNSIGKHLLTVEVIKNGLPFSQTITFTVVD